MKKIFVILFSLIAISTIVLPIFFDNTYAATKEQCTYTDAAKKVQTVTCDLGERIDDGSGNNPCCPGGLMVCGTPCCRCRFCDIFKLIDRIIDFAVFKLAPIAAVILIIIGGTMFLISSGNPGLVTRAKSIIFSVIIGLAIMYSSYMIVGFVLKSIGIAQWTADMYSSWLSKGVFEIDCGETKTTSGSPSSGGGSSGTLLPGAGSLPGSSYCDALNETEKKEYTACIRLYGGEGNNPHFDQCEANPCGANPLGGGCKIDPGFPGITVRQCVNK